MMITFLSDLLSLLIRHSKYESISVVNPTKKKKKRDTMPTMTQSGNLERA